MSEQNSTTWITPLRSRSYELDFAGIVNNAVYLQYLELARLDFLQQRGCDLTAALNTGSVYPVVARAEIDYRAPIKGIVDLAIHGCVAKIGRTSTVFTYEIRHQTDDIVFATAKTVIVFVDTNGHPTPIPEEYKSFLDVPGFIAS